MYSSNIFDIRSAQPLFIHIKKCMMFENQLVSLNPAYKVEFKEEIYSVTRDPEYTDLTSIYGLDILVLCGKNGVGKSTLLRIFKNQILPGDPDYNLVWKDKNGALLSRDYIDVKIDGESKILESNYMIDSIAALCANGAKQNKANSFRGGLLQLYSQNSKLYDQVLEKDLFDGFYVDYETDYASFDELEESVSRKLGIELVTGGFRDLLRKHPTMHVLAWLCSQNVFDDELNKLKARNISNYKILYRFLADEQSRALDKLFLELRQVEIKESASKRDDFGSFDERILKIDPKIEEKTRRYYKLSEYPSIRRQIAEVSNLIGDWITSRFSWINPPGDVLDEQIVWFHPFKNQTEGTISGMWDLSDGERLKLDILFSLVPYLIQRDGCWFHIDDWDGELHPEWKRKFIYELLTTYQKSVKAVRKAEGWSQKFMPRQTCVISTHSPFLLSDLLPQNVLLLIKGKDGNTTIRRGENPTFAGNIGELFHTEFFMESTIGEFARHKIQRMLKKLEKRPSQKTIDSAKNLFEKVGDEILRNLLLEKIRNATN